MFTHLRDDKKLCLGYSLANSKARHSNGLGYSAWLVNSMSCETATSAPLSVNKHLFKEYLMLFLEDKEAVALKAAEKATKGNPSTQTEVLSATSQVTSNRKSSTNVASLFGWSSLSPQALAKRLLSNVESSRKIQSNAKSKPGKNIFAFVGITSERSVCLQLFGTLLI